MRRSLQTILVYLFFSSTIFAQDTLRVTLKQADSLLLARNLLLISAQYEIDKAEARKIQEKLFINPELYTEWSAYNRSNNRWLETGSEGQKIIQLQKVFQIAGQRKASIQLAEEQKKMTQWQYAELMRSLRYELHVSYYRYYFLNHAITNISSRLILLKNLINIYEQQYIKGNISLQELARLKSTYFDISNQINSTKAELVHLQENLQILLADDRTIRPLSVEGASDVSNIRIQPLEELIERSLQNRPEIKEVQSYRAQRELKYTLEKKQAIPNLMAGGVYDQAGSYIPHYTGVSVGFQIPVFNRNQGKIQEAKIDIQQSDVLLQHKEQEIRREVVSAYRIYRLLQEQYNTSGADFEEQLDLLSQGLISNYSKNNISLLEFTDMFESYNSSIIQLYQLKAELTKSYEELNYVVGEDIRQ